MKLWMLHAWHVSMCIAFPALMFAAAACAQSGHHGHATNLAILSAVAWTESRQALNVIRERSRR